LSPQLVLLQLQKVTIVETHVTLQQQQQP